MMGSIPEVTLISSAGEKKIPVVGFGTATFPFGDDEAVKLAVLEGIKLGYRHFDTAAAYKSEQPLGETIAEAIDLGLIKSRDELFITSKLWCGSTERNLVVPSLKTSLQNLQLEYLDLYLIHWPLRFSTDVFQTPVPKEQLLPFDTKSVWEAMEECQNLGLTKSIGVSNFSCKKLTELLSTAKITPAVNQVEMNTSWQQTKLREFCKGKGIHITGYSPLGAHGTRWGDNRVVENQVLEEIGKPRGKTAAQVCLRWIYEQGASMVVKSFNKNRMKANLDIFDWELTEEELKKISQLPQRKAVLPTAAFGDHDEEPTNLGGNGTQWGDNRVVENPVLEEIGKPRGKTAAQVCLRWIYEQGASIVVKSFNKERMKANLGIFDWELTEEELKRISQLPQRKASLPTACFGDEVRELDYEI